MSSLSADELKALLREMVGWRAPEDAMQAVVRLPQLLSAAVQAQLEQALDGPWSEQERGIARQAIEALRAVRASFEEAPEALPLGDGPIEALCARVASGELGAPQAIKEAGTTRVAHALSPVYVMRLMRAAYGMAVEGEWRQAILASKVLQAALTASGPSPELATLSDQVICDFLEIAGGALGDVPDPRLFHEAREAGEALRQRALEQGNRAFAGRVLHALGVLHLDPYAANRDSRFYDLTMSEWRARMTMGLTWDGHPFPHHPAGDMPTPADAIRSGERYFRLAARLREGSARGLSLKALVQALAWRRVVGLPARPQRLKQAGAEALRLLDPVAHLPQLVEVMGYLEGAGADIDAGILDRMFSTSLDEVVRRRGPEAAMRLTIHTLGLLYDRQPRRALELLLCAQPLFTRHADEALLSTWAHHEFHVLRAVHAPEYERPPKGARIETAVEELRRRAVDEHWDASRLALTLVALAEASSPTSEEPLGLQLIEEATRIAPLTLSLMPTAMARIRGTLWLNDGSNAVEREEWAEAMERYARALAVYLESGLRDFSRNAVRRIADLAKHAGSAGVSAVADGLWPSSTRLETLLGEEALDLVQGICGAAMASLQQVNAQAMHTLWQLGKGQRFGRVLASGAARRMGSVDDAGHALRSIRDLEEGETQQGAVLGNPLDRQAEQLLLTPFRRQGIALSGDSPAERAANLRHRFDVDLNERLAAGAGALEEGPLALEQIQQALGGQTVLLEYFVGRAEGALAVYNLLVDSDDVAIGRVMSAQDQGGAQITVDGVQLELSGLTVGVQNLRRSLLEEPEGGEVSAGAAESLELMSGALVDGLRPRLDALRAKGKTHLAIVPHGSLHYLPFHLLGPPGRLLADEWLVSYLPNLRLLLPQRGPNALLKHREGTTAFGVSFTESELGLAPIPQAVSEAREVAQVAGGKAMVEEEATQEAVLQALERSRFVHIATHGSHDPGAPSFQCLYLASHDGDDGRLFAHEVLASDLRNLELVTLSACETALGRFDPGDNLRGLPAALLLAGASALVGTLWPVETRASEAFFVAMYRELTAGRTRLAAFAAAQAAVRQDFPEYRDWGPFYYIGSWD